MFTPRERAISQFVQEGLSNKEIAFVLGISERGVKFHVSNLLRKTGAENRGRLARMLLDNNPGIFVPSGEEDEPALRNKLSTLKQHKEALVRRERMVESVISACEAYLSRSCHAA